MRDDLWTEPDIKYLRSAYPGGRDLQTMCRRLRRSSEAIQRKAISLGLRRPKVYRALIDAATELRRLRTCRDERDIARLYLRAGRNYGPDDLTFKRQRAGALRRPANMR